MASSVSRSDAADAPPARQLVWLASYPKSGNTWTRILLANFLDADKAAASDHIALSGSISSNRPRFDSLTGLPSSDMTDDEIDCLRPGCYRALAEDSREQLFIKVHDAYHDNREGKPIFPAEISLGAIYLVRDPRDVAISYAHHQGHMDFAKVTRQLANPRHVLAGSRKSQLRQTMGTWSDHYRSWTAQQDIPVLVIRYEDMLEDTVAALRAMTGFLKLPDAEDEARLQQAVDNARFEKLQAAEKEKGFSERPEKAKQFFRSGKAGEWRDVLDVADRETIEADHGKVMRLLGYL
ncbi:MAG: sulfotransferase domain-containing protein [Pseudomonadota bacterium]